MSGEDAPSPKELWSDARDAEEKDSGDGASEFRTDVSREPRRIIRDGHPRMARIVPAPGEPNENSGPLSRGWRDPSGRRRAHGRPLRQGGCSSDFGGLHFNVGVTPGGYAWWYLDAFSDDRTHGITIIAFIGSVFSPYYAWSKKRDPYDHCALNIALYNPKNHLWAMTERDRDSIEIRRNNFHLGRSGLRWEKDALIIDVHETTAPIPRTLRGRIRLTADIINDREFLIDRAGRHRWRPIAPSARIEVDFDQPNIKWNGRAYLDMNEGEEPLEDVFEYWDWCRADISKNETAIVYNTDLWTGEKRSIAMKLSKNGSWEELGPLTTKPLDDTPIWRMRRRTLSDANGESPSIIKTFEDTPFYSRSMMNTEIMGQSCRAMHESLSGARLRAPVVKAMLPFRMPRLSHHGGLQKKARILPGE